VDVIRRRTTPHDAVLPLPPLVRLPMGWDGIATTAASNHLPTGLSLPAPATDRPSGGGEHPSPTENGPTLPAAVDPLGAVAREEPCPRDGLLAYGAEVIGGAIVIPTYGEDGQPC
jgi:hypothetical protein